VHRVSAVQVREVNLQDIQGESVMSKTIVVEFSVPDSYSAETLRQELDEMYQDNWLTEVTYSIKKEAE